VGETAIVLGASSGVGYHIAKALAQDCGVVGFHRGHYPDGAQRLTQDHDVLMLEADCGTVPDDVADAIELLEQHVAKQSVAVLVHSLSGASVGPLVTQNPAAIERTFNRLAHSYFWWVQGLLKTQLLAPSCTFVALSNPCPDFYLANTGVIGAAKAALEAYVRLLGCELGNYGQGLHRAVGIRFSTVLTPALEKVMPAAIPGLVKLHNEIQPQHRMQTAENVAEIVRSIALQDTPWINGTTIDATGGAPLMLMNYAFKSASR